MAGQEQTNDPRYNLRRSRRGGFSGGTRSAGSRPASQTGPVGTPGQGGISSRPGGSGSLPSASLPQPRIGGSSGPRRELSDASSSKVNPLPSGYASSVPLSARQLADKEAAPASAPALSDNPDKPVKTDSTPPRDTKETSEKSKKDADDSESGEPDKGKRKGFRNWVKNNKRKAATFGILSVLMGGGGFSAFLLMPVLEGGVIMQEAKTMERSDAKGQQDSAFGVKRFFRWARAIKKGNYGETRVGWAGSKIYGAVLDDLAKSGVTFELNGNGSLGKVHLDTNKLKAKYPELEGMNSTEQKDFLREKFGLTGDAAYNLFESPGGDGHYFIDSRYLDYKTTRVVASNSLALAEDGKIPDAIKTRVVKRVWNLPSAFHPWERLKAKVTNNVSGRLSRSQESDKAESDRLKAVDDTIAAQGDGAVASAEEKSSGVRGSLTKALTVTGTACVIYSIADDVVQINHSRIVQVASARANDVKAASSQMMYGRGSFDSSQPGALAHSQIDSHGKGIADSAAYRSASTDGTQRGGFTMPLEYIQAFASNTTAANIRDGVDMALLGSAPTLCSPAGLIAQGVAMVGLSFVGDPATLLAPKIFGKFIAKQASNALVSGVAMHFATEFILNKATAAKLTEAAFKGPLGGELLMYGARAASNTVGIASGGVALGNNTSTMFAAQFAAQEKQDFQHKNAFARVFDATDSNSLMGHLAMAVSPSFSGNLTSFASGLLNVGHTMSSMMSSVMPKVSAGAPFDWGFPQYGIPDEVLNDPQLQDPYGNASAVATLLDTNAAGQHGTYKDQAMTCFGDNITNDNALHQWNVVPTKDVNTGSQEYTDAHCDDLSDLNWRRMIMFVNDTNTMNAVACFQGDKTSCTDVAADDGTAPTSSSSSTQSGDTSGTGSATDPYAASDTMACAAGSDKGVQDGYNKGTLVKIKICDVQGIQVNARIAENVDHLLNAASAAGVKMGGSGFATTADQVAKRKANHCPDIYKSPASACTPNTAIPGYSNHQMGLAIDFTQNGSTIKAGSPGFKWLTANAATYGLKNLPTEAWHWSVDGN